MTLVGATTPGIEVSDLCKNFGDVPALRGVSFRVPQGSVLTLLGTNGAGKTTTVRILSTLLRPTSGSAKVLGLDSSVQRHQVRQLIGLTGQFSAIDPLMTGRENLLLVSRLRGSTRQEAAVVADELIDQLGLDAVAGRPARTYSGGTRRRLDLACSLVGHPSVLVLDEPTTGLDPASRQALWERVAQLVTQGTTLLLTTQYLEEADRLADNVVVIDKGMVVGHGTPAQLKRMVGLDSLVVELTNPGEARRLADRCAYLEGIHTVVTQQQIALTGSDAASARTMAYVTALLVELDLAPTDFGIRRPSLDDVFSHLTAPAAVGGRP